MRDPRMIAVHRGGLLALEHHRLLSRWAVDCAERVLPFFAAHRDDPRPAQAIETGRTWARGEIKTGVAMKASLAVHAAARAATDPIAIAAARAAGQAVATAHCADHSLGGLLYALKALHLAGQPWQPEMEVRLAELPPELLARVVEGVDARLKVFKLKV